MEVAETDESKNDVFDALGKVVTRLKPYEKFSILLFKEFNLNVEAGENQVVRDNPPDCCFSFMLRGVSTPWKQPIVNCLLRTHQKTPIRLAEIIKDAIHNSLRSGLTILATVSPSDKLIIDAIEILRNESMDFLRGMRKFTGEHDESYVVDCNIIHHIYDPCRLIRSFRNQLKDKDLIYEMNGKKCVASWKAILRIFSIDKSRRGKHKLRKIGLQHIMLTGQDLLITSRATQIFSETVGNEMLCFANKNCPSDYEDTGLLVLFLDKLFDSCNADTENMMEGKPFRKPIKTGSPHFQFWNKSLEIIDSMRFVNSATGLVHRPICLDKWASTIQGFINIWKIVCKSKMKTVLCTRRFNLDPINNLMQILQLLRKHSAHFVCESTDSPILDLEILKMVVTSEYGYYEVADD